MMSATDAALAVLLGGMLAAGVLCLLGALPRWRAAPLPLRIAPYVRDIVDDDVMPASSLPRAGVLPSGRSLLARARGLAERALGGDEALSARLAQAGGDDSPAAFRGRQLGGAVIGLALGAAVMIVVALAGTFTPIAAALPLLLGAGGVIIPDMLLTARANARRARIGDELPTVLEFLALCLSAGEGFLDALRRVAAVGSGELSGELRQVVLAVGTGSPLADALGEMSGRLRAPGLARATDQMIAALEHGAPLAGVLQAQAADAREEAKRGLIEQSGQREIYMLIPLVFLILPLSVLFAKDQFRAGTY